MRWFVVFSSLAASLVATSSAGAEPAVTKGPYLQHLSASAVEIRIELASAAAASLEIEFPDQTRRTQSDAISAFHSFRIAGLSPAVHYGYAVRVGRDVASSGEFTTAPADDSTAPFSFLLYGDDRTDHAAHEAIIRAIEHEPFDFLVHTGDFVQQGGVDAYWQQFFDIERNLLRDHCVFACIGNHELFEDSSAEHYERYFGASTDVGGPPYGTLRWGNARFFLLNAFESWSGPERSWLEATLAAADSEPGLSWRIAVVHHCPWSAGPHGDNKKMLQAHIDDLLARHHVDLVHAGHDHIYERGEAKELKYVISGGAGAPLYSELSPEPSTRKVESSYHYVLFSLTDHRLVETAKRVDGSLIETCGFLRGSDWDCDAKKNVAAPPGAVAPPQQPATSSRCGCSVPGWTEDAWQILPSLSLVLLGVCRRRGVRRPAEDRAGRRGRRSPRSSASDH